MSRVYTVTMLVSALLLFLVEPMFARMVLPLLGGSPAVWNTAMVFYQVALLVGYVYAHAATAWLGVRRQAALHAALILLPMLVLPIRIPAGWVPPTESNPIPWLLGLMLLRLGLPFAVLSATSPMLQKWFASTPHPNARDPYFLYAASNVGSLFALLAYPLLIEPRLRLAVQSRLWAIGYGVLVVLMLACALIVWRSPRRSAEPADAPLEEAGSPAGAAGAGQLTARRRARWVLLAFVPSSLMLSVTTYFSTNLTPFPLLWVLPLAIYLLSFILVFAQKPLLSYRLSARALSLVLLPLVITLAMAASGPIWLLVPLHLFTLFLAAMVCHGALAQDRPPAKSLTEFYLWLSVGGALGGVFNALLAPILFSSVVEYPLGLVLAILMVRWPSSGKEKPSARWLDLGLPVALGALMAALALSLRAAGVKSVQLTAAVACGLPAVISFSFSRRPVRFALSVGAMLLVSALTIGPANRVLYAERSFFGVSRVVIDQGARHHLLFHGDTLHGMQSLDPSRRCEPLSYYYGGGPISAVFAAFSDAGAKQRVAIVGLGSGALSSYSQPGQQWTFYEIDPTVERIARDPRWFTFLQDCAPSARVVLGDARLSLARATSAEYDLMILDAYSSDAIPVHLITREALALYLDKLAPQGVLAFHISNRYLDLQPVLGQLAYDAGLVALAEDDFGVRADESPVKSPSRWVVMARDEAALGKLTSDSRWQRLEGRPGVAVWTDDYSSIVSVIHWR